MDLIAVGPHVPETGHPLSDDEQQDIQLHRGVGRTSVTGLEVQIVVNEEHNDEEKIAGHVADKLAHWGRPGLGKPGARCQDVDDHENREKEHAQKDSEDALARPHCLEALPVFQPVGHHHLYSVYSVKSPQITWPFVRDYPGEPVPER